MCADGRRDDAQSAIHLPSVGAGFKPALARRNADVSNYQNRLWARKSVWIEVGGTDRSASLALRLRMQGGFETCPYPSWFVPAAQITAFGRSGNTQPW